MSNNSGHAMVSNVTPWWWSTRWGSSEIKRAVVALLSTKKFEFSRIDITRDALQVELQLGEQEDANRAQDRVNELRTALDDMVILQ